MSAEARLREEICCFARSIFERGLTGGASGNISARLPDGASSSRPPARASAGSTRPGSRSSTPASASSTAIRRPRRFRSTAPSTPPATAPAPSSTCIRRTRSRCRSCPTPTRRRDPPLTAYAVMRLGRVRLLPYFMPGDPAMGEAVRALAGQSRRCCSPTTARWWPPPTSRPRSTRWRSSRRPRVSRSSPAACRRAG